ncbi:hypothetical protein L3V86_06750 [Thiotrichales bacterium 19S11-10]|nr:hypothetical protein [Thiotrichales bacterium 19S11-10]
MKKIALATILSTMIVSSSALASEDASNSTLAKSGFIVESQLSLNATPKGVFNELADQAAITRVTNTYNGGFGGALYLGYDYAISSNMTVGGKIGYQYIYALNEYESSYSVLYHSSLDAKLNMNNIPVLATFKYYFNSGWLLGAQAGVDVQMWTLKRQGGDAYLSQAMEHESSYSSDWNVAPMVGLSGGYQWSNGLAVTGDLSYVFGQSTNDITTVDSSDALGFYTIGLSASYKLPF